MNNKWSIEYKDYLFEKVVPLYKKAGTPIYGSNFKIGAPVYIKDCNSIGFIINGPVDEKEYEEWFDEIKTDTDGNRSVFDLEPLTSSHILNPGVHNPFTDCEDIMTYFKSLGEIKPPKIFEFYWDAGGYGNGVMLVVASSFEDAVDYAKVESKNWYFDNERTELSYTGAWDGQAFSIVRSFYQE